MLKGQVDRDAEMKLCKDAEGVDCCVEMKLSKCVEVKLYKGICGATLP